jgi:acetolactate decarboxylase
MFHDRQTGPTVFLNDLLHDADLYAVGALAELSGEVTVLGGKVYLSFPEGESVRTETPASTDAAATLLVASRVPSWRSVTTDRPIRCDQLDDEIARLAVSAGQSLDERLPFLMEGTVEDLHWHVIDGRRLTGGENSHQDHRAAAVNGRLERGSARLVGFYSESDQGVFTHLGSKTHIHCVIGDPLVTGHLDHVVLPAGSTVKFPDREKRRNEGTQRTDTTGG